MGVIIEESGLKFGEYSEKQVFHIEECVQYTKSLRQKEIKTCEFILQRGKKLYFIEAKASSPKEIAGDIPAEDKKHREKSYTDFVEEIVLKMRHSLSLYGNILLKRYEQDSLPENMANADLSDTQINLVLVINTEDGNWKPSPELQDALRFALRKEINLWRIGNLFVINAEMARKKYFII